MAEMKWMARSALLLVLATASAWADTAGPFEIVESEPASEFWLNAGMYSYHFQQDKGLNNNNPGFGVEYRYSNVASFTVGGFYNSDRQTSHYVGWYWQPVVLGPVRLGAALGGFDGYPRMHDGGWFAAILPTASVEYGRVGLNMFFVPTYEDKLYGALSFQLKVRVD